MGRISEILTVDVHNPSCDNPFYVRWLAPGGDRPYDTRPRAGWGYWLFDYSQAFGVNTSDGDKIDLSPTVFETATAREQITQKTGQHRVKLTAECSEVDHVRGLETLLYAIRVEYLKDQANDIWQEVFVVPGSFETYETAAGFYVVELTVEFQPLMIQTG